MRIACSTFSFDQDFAACRIDIAGYMDACKDIGLDAVELNGGYLSKDKITVAQIKRRAVELALDVCALAIETVVYVADEDGVRAYTRNMLDWLDVCAALGAPILRVNTAQPENGMHEVPSTVTEARVRNWAVKAFREVAKAARAKGIVLAMENHYGLTRTSADTLRFIRSVGAANMAVNIDTGNCWENPHKVRSTLAENGHIRELRPFEDPYQLVGKLASSMVFSHCKIFRLSENGLDDVVLDYGRILRTFSDHGYRGYLSIENFTNEDPSDLVCRAARMLRAQVAKLAPPRRRALP